MAITAGMSKCVGAACVRGIVVKEVILGRHRYPHTPVCTNFYGECSLCIFLALGRFAPYSRGMIISCMLCGGL